MPRRFNVQDSHPMPEGIDKSRRSFLKMAGFLGLSVTAPHLGALISPAAAAASESIPLRLFNPHTDERYDIQLFVGNEWNPMGLVACDWMMRDWREKAVVHCDRRLYAALYVLQRFFNPAGPISINSGYRSRKTNDMLRSRSLGENGGKATWMTPAINSLHTRAMALDFVVPGVSIRSLGDAVWDLRIGGLGRYDTFIHMDTGHRRRWGNR